MPEIELTAGPIEYADTGGDGPVIVFLHGLTIDGSIWQDVVVGLGADYRCVVPTFPLGSHRWPMRPEADLSLAAMGHLVAEFLERLDLTDVTVVFNDWGGAQPLIASGRTERVGRLVLSACEAFDNFPPGLPGRMLVRAAAVAGGLALAMQALRLRAFRRAPLSWGWMSKRPVPKAMMDDWFRPATTNRDIRHDLKKYLRANPPKSTLLEWAERMAEFDRPVLVVWAPEDRLMPRDHGSRLAAVFPDARLVEIADSYTLIPIDQPEAMTRTLRDFVTVQVADQ